MALAENSNETGGSIYSRYFAGEKARRAAHGEEAAEQRKAESAKLDAAARAEVARLTAGAERFNSPSEDADIRTDAGWRKAWDALQRCNLEIVEIEQGISAAQGRLNTEATADRKSALDKQAEGYLVGKEPRVASLEAFRGEVRTLQDRRRVVQRAREIARQNLEAETHRASELIRDRLAPKHRAIMVAKAKAMIALAETEEAEREFFNTLDAGQVMWGDLAVTAAGIGNPASPHSRIAMWFSEAIRKGWCEAKIVPAAWRARWGL